MCNTKKSGCQNCGGCASGQQEKWREDFPVEWAADNYITRREFARFLIFTSGATFLGSGYFALRGKDGVPQTTAPVRIVGVDEMPVGSAKLFRYPTADDPALLIRLTESHFVAFRQRCTHLSGPVIFNPKNGSLDCPCHNGVFDAQTGRVLEGPPPRPLPQIIVQVADNAVWAHGLAPENPADNSPGRSAPLPRSSGNGGAA